MGTYDYEYYRRGKHDPLLDRSPQCVKKNFWEILVFICMKHIITEEQYKILTYMRRYDDIKKLIDNLSDNPSLYDDEDEFYNDIKDLVYNNVFLGNRKNLSWDEIDQDDLMLFIDNHFQDYIRNKYRDENGY
jgi:hypothetical protein